MGQSRRFTERFGLFHPLMPAIIIVALGKVEIILGGRIFFRNSESILYILRESSLK